MLRDGRIYQYAGVALTGTVNLATQTYTVAGGWLLLASPSNLAAENYGDTTKWAPVPDGVELATMDYSDTTLWKLVGLDRTGAAVEAYVTDASIEPGLRLSLAYTGVPTARSSERSLSNQRR